MIKNKKDISTLVASGILELEPYRSARDEFAVDEGSYAFLDANEHPIPTPVNRYPDPYHTALRKQIAHLKGLSPDQLLLGNGSDEVLDLLFRVFCEPVDAIVTLAPTYGMYGVLAQQHRVRNIELTLSADFQPDVDEILQTVDRNTKMLFVCSPNNPSGNLIDADRIKALLSHFNGMVVIDEAYIDFSNSESWARQLDTYPNLVVLQTFSKAYGMAGIRLGMAIANPKVILWLTKIKLPYNVNTLTQEFAKKQLKNIGEINTAIVTLKNERAQLAKALASISYVTKVFPSEANFLLVRVTDASAVYNALITMGIVVRNRSSLPHCEECLRITVGTSEENEQLISALKQVTL